MLQNLSKFKILLASRSPRRRELLGLLRIPFTIVSVGKLEEVWPEGTPVEQVPEYLSRLKADAYRAIMHPDEIIITADTVVILDGRIFGKPKDEADAKKMLRALAGRTHKVVTGVCVTSEKKQETFSTTTQVTFANLTDKEIDYYVDNFRPMDKAGAYGIQEWIGAAAVERIDGSFYNVMGLPIHQLYNLLKEF